MINLCLVVIATQFSETKKREMERMLLERKRYTSSSTLASNSEPGGCYNEIIKYISHLFRKSRRRLNRWLRAVQAQRRRRVTPDLEVSMSLQRRGKRRIKHRRKHVNTPATDPQGSPSLARSSRRRLRRERDMLKNNGDVGHRKLSDKVRQGDCLDELSEADMLTAAAAGLRRPTLLRLHSDSLGFSSIVSLFSSNSLPTPPPSALRLSSPPYIARDSLTCVETCGQYLLVPLDIIRQSSLGGSTLGLNSSILRRQSSVGPESEVDSQTRRSVYHGCRSPSISCETCGNVLPITGPSMAAPLGGVAAAAENSLSAVNNQVGSSQSDCDVKTRQNTLLFAQSKKDTTNAQPQRRNSAVQKAASFSGTNQEDFLQVHQHDGLSSLGGKSRRRDSFMRTVSLKSNPSDNYLTLVDASVILAALRKQGLAMNPATTGSTASNKHLPQHLSENMCRDNERRCRNSFSRGTSLQAGPSQDQSPGCPASSTTSRRNSIGRTTSLSTGADVNVVRCAGVSGNFLSVPTEMFGSRRPSTSSTNSLHASDRVLRLSPSQTTYASDTQNITPAPRNLALSHVTQSRDGSRDIIATQRNSVMRASSLNSGTCRQGNYLLKNVRDGAPRSVRRPSFVSRASSLSTGGPCGKYHPLLRDRQGLCRSTIVAPAGHASRRQSHDHHVRSNCSMLSQNVKSYNTSKSTFLNLWPLESLNNSNI